MEKLKLLLSILGVIFIAIMPLLGLMAIYMLPFVIAGTAALFCLIHSSIRRRRAGLALCFTDFVVLAFIFYALIRSILMFQAIQWELCIKWSALVCIYLLFRFITNRAVLFYGLTLGGTVQSIIGILQITGLMEASTPLFEITGSFSNPGPYAGFLSVCCICSVSFAIIQLKENTGKGLVPYILLAAAMLMAVMIVIADSRAAIVAASGGVALLIFYNLKTNIRKWYLVSAAAVLVILVCLLYLYRRDSADGRMLIWRVSADMICDAPLAGHGLGTFDKAYMPYQMEFFKKNPDSGYVKVAGLTKFPYNEFIHIAVDCGVAGLVLFVLLLASVFFNKNGNQMLVPIRCSIAAWCIFSCFSYPVEIFALIAVLVMLIAMGSSARGNINIRGKFAFLAGITAFCLAGAFVTVRWNSCTTRLIRTVVVSERKMLGKEALRSFVNKNCKELKANRHLYDRSVLNLCELSNDIREVEHLVGYVTPSCMNYCAIGKIYLRSGQYELAEKYFSDAHYMVPTMITPIYEIFKLHQVKGDNDKASIYAEQVLEMPIKIENTKTLRAKNEARKFLEK